MPVTKIAVVGGGLAGLAASAVAARAGAEVTLYEARSSHGGRARTVNRSEFLFNEGAHALYLSGEGMQVLKSLGIEPKGGKPPLRSFGRLRGEVGLMPGSPLDSIRSPLFGFRTKLQLGKVLARPKRALTSDLAGRSMQDWIEQQVSDPDARLVVAMAARTAVYQADLETVTAAVVVPQLVSALTKGVCYLDGGWQQLVSALKDVALAAGARITTDRKIESIDELTGWDAVILAVGGPGQAHQILNGRSLAVKRWAADARPVYASTLDLGMRSLPIPVRRFCLGVDEPMYFSCHTPSASLAPNGGALVNVLRYGADALGSEGVRSEMESFLDAVQPGWRPLVVAEQFARQRVVAYDRPRLELGALANRPGPTIPDCPGVFVAGDWVGSAGLLADAAMASGHEAALAALGAPSPPVSG
jgi:hypothetical protein